MKPALYRISLLVSCASFALCTFYATRVNADAEASPSIEIHLDALSRLAKTSTSGNPNSATDSPFGRPTPPIRTASSSGSDSQTSHHKKAVHVAKAALAHPYAHLTASVPSAKKTVASLPKQNNTSLTGANNTPTADKTALNEIPKPETTSSMAGSPPPVHTLKSVSMAHAAPKAPASAADVPALPVAETASVAPTPKPTGMVSDISKGFSDILSDEPAKADTNKADKTLGETKTANALPFNASAMSAPAPAPAAAMPTLASPPSDLTMPASSLSAASADKDTTPPPPLLSALADPKASSPDTNIPPPLSPAVGSNNSKDTGKMVMASNDLSSMGALPFPSEQPGKSDLPSLPPSLDTASSTEKEPSVHETQMAQETLTPLQVPPIAAPPTAPSLPTLAAKAPEPQALPAPPASPPPVPTFSSATPAITPPATAPVPPAAGAAAVLPNSDVPPAAVPDLKLVFNESETDVPLNSTDKLDALAKALADSPSERVILMAYASGPETTGIYPKRVSLARGIAVRNYLTSNKGIDIVRVNVKALGNKNAGDGPGDRVDVFVVK